jgi:hypothetical protein
MQEITAASCFFTGPTSRLFPGTTFPEYHVTNVPPIARINMLHTMPADTEAVHITFSDQTSGWVLPAWRIDGTATAAYVLNRANAPNHGFVKRQVIIGGMLFDISCEIVVLSCGMLDHACSDILAFAADEK